MRLEISCQDRLGITQDILDILVRHQIDLRGIEIDPVGKIFLNFPNIEFSGFQHLMPEIRRIKGIEDVKTTPFMPMEREQNQLRALLETLPDPVFSVDPRGRILLVNGAVSLSLEMPVDDILGTEINEYVKGFNFGRWIDANKVEPQAHKVKFIEQDFLADILPVVVPGHEGEGKNILAGALLMLKSEFRLGQQLTVFNQGNPDSFAAIQANSSMMKKVVKEAKKMAALDGHILLYGETGTGKERLAKACHDASRRAGNDFLALNCASLPDEVAETELFGAGPGIFSNGEPKAGLLELAQGGTLFLDEVGEMSSQLQTKLLRVLQDGTYRRIGDAKEMKVDVRFICATQKDLNQLVMDGKFREDLYYRLNVLNIFIPPLRERRTDIVPLADTIIRQHCARLGRHPVKLSKSCVEYLQGYPWPGNVRQLENTLYRALSLNDGNELSKEHIQLPSNAIVETFSPDEIEGTLDDEVKRFEKNLLRRLYPAYPSTRQLAKKLGLSHTAIANKLREYGINKKTVKI